GVGSSITSIIAMQYLVFAAAAQGRHVLAGIEPLLRVEGMLDGMELHQFIGLELDEHLIDLLHTDTVLTGDRAAIVDAQLADVAPEGFGALKFPGLVGVVQNERV